MTLREMPDRLKEFLHWIEGEHPAAEVLQRIQDHLAEVHQDIEALEGEAEIVESLLGYLSEHHLPLHPGEPVTAVRVTGVPRGERGQRILEMAHEIVSQGQLIVTPRDVERKLFDRRLDLDVKYPTTVIGNVLARSPDFKRLERNRFEYIGTPKDLTLASPKVMAAAIAAGKEVPVE